MTNKNKLSPQKYIIKNGRSLPFHECYINEDWQESGLATFFISKKMHGGNYIFVLYLVDIYCLGLKNTLLKFNITEPEKKKLFELFISNHQSPERCDIVLAHDIIFGAIDYAKKLGFEPHKDFKITEYLLNPDLISNGIDEIEFGREGKPFYISGPNDNVPQIINTLNRTIGEGNYDFMAEQSQFLNL